jgi:RNA polymerase sigma-70 factor (ECF subfamily)
MNTDDTISAAMAECLQRLERGDLTVRDRIIELCSSRLHALAHRMLGRFPGVRRWEDTDDVFQNAAMRLHRALGDMQLE